MMRAVLFLLTLLVAAHESFALPRGSAFNGTEPPPQCIPTAPTAPAAAGSYTCAEFDATFTTMANVDTTDSLAPGFALYVHNTFPNTQVVCWPAPFDISDLSIVSGSLQFNGDSFLNAHGVCADLMTVAWTGGTSYVGKTFRPGIYVDVIWSYAVPVPGGVSCDVNNHPNIWLEPITALLSTVPAHTSFIELDNFETFCNLSVQGGERSWPIDTYSSVAYDNNNQVITPYVPNDGALHHYGLQLIPTTDGGGTGYIRRTVDGSFITYNDCTYSFTAYASCSGSSGLGVGGYTQIDTTDFAILFSAAFNWPIKINRITVYCNPSAVTCSQ